MVSNRQARRIVFCAQLRCRLFALLVNAPIKVERSGECPPIVKKCIQDFIDGKQS